MAEKIFNAPGYEVTEQFWENKQQLWVTAHQQIEDKVVEILKEQIEESWKSPEVYEDEKDHDEKEQEEKEQQEKLLEMLHRIFTMEITPKMNKKSKKAPESSLKSYKSVKRTSKTR